MSCGADNLQAKMAIKDGTGAVDFSSGATPIEFTSESVIVEGQNLISEGIRGTRSTNVSQTRRGAYTIGGAVNFDLSVAGAGIWFTRALGANASGVITPTEALPVFGLLADKVSGVFRYDDCKVSQLRIGATGAEIVSGTATIAGRGYGEGVAFPSLTLGSDAVDSPLVASDLALLLATVAYECGSFELLIDNAIQTIQRNALTPSCNREGARVVTLNANLPSTSSAQTALREPDLSGIAADLALTSTLAAVGVDIDLPVCQKPRRDPNVAGRGEQTWDISLQAVTDASNTNEITVTTDLTE